MIRMISILILLSMTCAIPGFSQNGYTVTISGPTTINTGTTYTYNVVWKYNGSTVSPPPGGTYTWTVYSGTAYSSGSTYAAIVWTGSGSALYQYTASGTSYYAIINVSASNCAPVPSLTFSLSESYCSPRILSYTGTPPSGVVWYWQTSPTGTSTANSSNVYSVTAAGTYYVRPYNTVSSCWGTDTRSYGVSGVTQGPATPSTPFVISSDPCGSKALSYNSPPSGVTYYWQGNNPNGTSTYYTGTTLAFTSGVYFLRARDNSTGCWSANSSSIYVSINNAPPDPATPSATSNSCGPQTLTKSGTPPADVTWYWQGTNASGTDYTSVTATGATYTATVSGYHYLRARHSNGCWSSSVAVSVTVNEIPSTPPTPNVTTNTCGPKTLTFSGSPPAGVTWYWQGTNANGTSTENAASSLTTSVEGTHYLRARNNTSGCWSGSSSRAFIINPIPAAPLAPSQSPNCGPVTLTKASSSASNSWYWQGTDPAGTDRTSATATSTTYTATATGTYYIRAFTNNSSGGCWSTPTAVSVTYNPLPATPSTPIIISTDPCGSKALSFSAPPSNVTYYWQGNDPNGTSTYNSGTNLAFSSGVYFLRARHNVTGCWSANSSSLYVTVDNGPPAPPVPTATANACGAQTISKSGTPPAGETWYWQGTNANGTDYTSANATAATYTANASGNYYLRPRSSNGCWGTASSVTVTVNQYPAVPATPGVSANACYDKTVSKNGTEPAGETWYWQGTNANGTDYTSATATAATFSISAHGSTTVYIRARNNTTGCWSTTAASVPVTVNNPAVPNGNSFQYCEFQSMALTTTGYTSSLKWYSSTDQLLSQGITYTPANLNIGNYTYKVKNVDGSCESTASANVTLTVKADCDEYMNWTEAVNFTVDATGASVPYAASRSYLNGFGNVLQTQSKSYTTNQVLAMENIPNYLGTTGITTLPAPTNRSVFSYRSRFVTNASGQKYKAADFDLLPATGASGEVNNPKAVGNNGPGTLGWYYSSANNLEPLTRTTSFPYSMVWVEAGPDPRNSKIAGPGDQHKMGSGHELKDEIQLWNTGDLSHYYAIRAHFVPVTSVNTALPGYKHISTDADGKKSVTFTDADGKLLATAAIISESPLTYDYWSYTFYNDFGRIVALVAPKGVVTSSTAYPAYATTYKYDHLGRLIETTSPDEGTSQFVYSLDGKLRFSQNQEQRNASPKRFSYTNYDDLGRLVEAGEYTESTGPGTKYVFEPHTTPTPAQYSVLTIADNNIRDIFNVTAFNYTGISRKLDAVRCNDHHFVYYDIADPGYVAYTTHMVQENLRGRISKTENANSITWYSYDELGQLLWSVQTITGYGSKSIDYKYDFLGNLNELAYQKDTPADRFYHHYTYDADNRLTAVHTSKDGTNKTLQAQYQYYLHGALKRMVLGNDLQGVDYTYTINGSLKGINHADPARDPGGDGADDVFGETLHYFDNDYTGAGYNAGTQTVSGFNNQYDGLLKASAWHSPAGNHQAQAYAYQYNRQNFLTNAQWGNVTASSGAYGFASATPYQEAADGYDKNGNIGTMLRKGKNSNTLADYSYVYEPGTNKLDKINQNAGLLIDYSYNAIGQLIRLDEGASKTFKIKYTAYGLVKEIRNNDDILVQTYRYDDRGNVLQKIRYDTAGSPQQYTTYITDVAGKALAIYVHTTAALPAAPVEVPVYGSARLGVYKPGANQYFYEVNDHIGNVRAVIGAPAITTSTANFETGTNNAFKHYSTHHDDLVDHTDAGTVHQYTQLLNGGYNGQIGVAKSLEVSPGDKIKVEVYAKYRNLSNTDVNLTGFAAALTGAFGLTAGAPGDPGQAYNALEDYGTVIAGGFDHSENGTAPKAYLNILLFDRNYNLVDAAYKQVTTAALQSDPVVKGPHDYMVREVTIEEPGYAYIFLSNENLKLVDVYFDDITVTHTQSPIVAGNDYYPFGLAMENREITDEPYRYGYQGQFSEKDITTGMQEFELRMYDPKIGRWLSPDPYGQFVSPYLAMGNTPHISIDVDGGAACPPACAPTFIEGIGYVLPEVTITATALTSSAISSALSATNAAAIARGSGGYEIEFNLNVPTGDLGNNAPPSSYPSPARIQEIEGKLTELPKPNTAELTSGISMPSAATIQNVASIAGWIPGVQTVAGVIEAGAAIYAGDYLGAGLAVAGAVPIFGYIAKSIKAARTLKSAYKISGVYDITVTGARFNGRYIGESGDIVRRLKQHTGFFGKFRGHQVKINDIYSMPGSSSRYREVFEQQLLNTFGGPNAPGILNKINPHYPSKDLILF